MVSKYRFFNAHTAASLLGTPAQLLVNIAQHGLSTWSRQPPEDQPEHQNGERRFKGLLRGVVFSARQADLSISALEFSHTTISGVHRDLSG